MHYAAMEQCSVLLRQAQIAVTVGTRVDNMVPDLHESHGYDLPSGRGPLISFIEREYEAIRQLGIQAKKDAARINNIVLSSRVRNLCHYCTDAHTIGQIVAEFWGRTDNRINVRSELTGNKKALPIVLMQYADKNQATKALIESLRVVYLTNYKRSKSVFFLAWYVDRMARKAVKHGAEFAAAYTYLALK